MLNKFLFKHIDNSALIVFRIIFGFLITAEAFGAIMTGWVKRIMVEPKFTFNFIGFDFLQPLVGEYMYVHFVIMGIFGICVMLGYKYRIAIIGYTIFWATTYFLQKSAYNNHYYLLIILCAMMALQPANRYLSMDAKRNPSLVKHSMPQWCSWMLIVQMFIVYTYGAIAKIYPDWLTGEVIRIFMSAKKHYFLVGDFLQEQWLHCFLSYGGILYDGLVIPLLLYKPTRKWAFMASVFFHMFNSAIFQVGIFPYMSLGLCIFFFEPKTIRNIFLKKKPLYEGSEISVPKYGNLLIAVLALHFAIQVALPLRHHFFKDDVLWTEEGHKLSWRMMLRAKNGIASFRVVTKDSITTTTAINLDKYVTDKQKRMLATHPDAIWQFAQRLKKEYNDKGKEVEIYVKSSIRVNGRPFEKYIDPTVDLAKVKWNAFKHSEWILPSKLDKIKYTNP